VSGVPYGLLVIRLALGLTLSAHGAQKLIGSFGGHGLGRTTGFFASLDFRSPRATAIAVGLAECSGGLLLAAGLMTPVCALAICILMLTAIATVHWGRGFWVTEGGYEFNLLIWANAVALATAGPGRFSVDALIGWADNLSGVRWGIGVTSGSLLGSMLVLWIGRRPSADASLSTLGNERATQEAVESETTVSSADNESWAIDSGGGRPANSEAVLADGFGLPSTPRTPIEIRVGDASEGNQLIDCLWRHGLPATLFENGGHWGVEVRAPREQRRRLLLDVVVALEGWLVECARPGLLLRVGERHYTMRPHLSR